MQIISFAPNPWDGPWMNRQQLLSRLGKHHQIIYTNGLWNRWQINEEQFQQAHFLGGYNARDNILVDIAPKYLLSWPTIPVWDRIVIQLGTNRWRRKLRQFNSGKILAYVFHPQYWPVVKQLKPDFLIYHAYDLYRLTPGWNEQLAENENAILKQANFCFGSSQTIVTDLCEKANGEVIFLPNGVDFELFTDPDIDNAHNPSDLVSIPHPRIGYIGNINRKVDLPLIVELAQRNHSWQFVIVGGIANLDEVTSKSLQVLRDMANIHLLGAKLPKELPKYANNMDINLMAYRTSDKLWTQAIYPLKLHEYLASGNPVISTDIPAVREFSHVVRIVDNDVRHWEEAINKSLKAEDTSKRLQRREVAKKNSWNERVKTVEHYISTLT
jgi:glycosyltransferase involved in cell wall biosynthesis